MAICERNPNLRALFFSFLFFCRKSKFTLIKENIFKKKLFFTKQRERPKKLKNYRFFFFLKPQTPNFMMEHRKCKQQSTLISSHRPLWLLLLRWEEAQPLLPIFAQMPHLQILSWKNQNQEKKAHNSGFVYRLVSDAYEKQMSNSDQNEFVLMALPYPNSSQNFMKCVRRIVRCYVDY